MRFGLVGTGHWARTVHAEALLRHPDAQLAGVWGRDGATSAAFADELHIRSYGDVEALFREVDAVAFAVPPDVQAGLAVQAAQQGKHLLLDKPLALTTADADRVVEAVAASGVRALVFFTQRFTPSIAQWLEQCRTGDEWISAHLRSFGSIYQPGNPFGQSPWRRRYGPLWDLGPHALSLLLPLLGPVERVHAERGRADVVELLLRHRGGGTSTVALALDAPAGSVGSSFELLGAAGTSRLPEADVSSLDAMSGCISAITRDVEPWAHPCDVDFGRDVVAVLEAAQRSLDGEDGAVAAPLAR